MTTGTTLKSLSFGAPLTEPEAGERFAERRRIALLEPDPDLRPVLIRTLLRLGCVVSAKRELAQIIETLQTGPVDGAIVALCAQSDCVAALQASNARQATIVVLTDDAVEPHLRRLFPAIHFLQKPFDMRDLLASLGLPEKATILTSG